MPDEKLPLKGKVVILTRAEDQSKESAVFFENAGVDLILFPVLEICEPANWSVFDQLIISTDFDYIIFTSANAVKMFSKRIKQLDLNFDFSAVTIVAVGKKTSSACIDSGIKTDIVPAGFSAEGVILELKKIDLTGKTIFIPRSALAGNEIVNGLSEYGAIVKAAVAYDVRLPSKEAMIENLNLIKNKKIDLIIFTSPSTFYNYTAIVGIENAADYFSDIKVAAIGKTTKNAIESNGVVVSIVPEVQTMDGLFNAITEYYLTCI